MKAKALLPAVLFAALLPTAACSRAGGAADDAARVAAATGSSVASAQRDTEAPAAEDKAVPAAGQADDQPRWHGFQTEEGTHIAYSIPDSDDAGPHMACQTGTGEVSITFWADHAIPGEPGPEARTEEVKLTMSSGSVTRTYDALASSEEMYGGAMVQASTTITDPVLVEFARTGRLRMKAYDDASDMPVAPRAVVDAFMKGCRKP